MGFCLFFLFFRHKYWISSAPNIQQRKKKKKHLAQKKAFVNGWLGAHRIRVPNFRIYLQKTAWPLLDGCWTNKFGAICLNQPVCILNNGVWCGIIVVEYGYWCCYCTSTNGVWNMGCLGSIFDSIHSMVRKCPPAGWWKKEKRKSFLLQDAV